MKKIVIGFSHSNNIFSKLIMWVTRSNISHAYIRVDETTVYQASGLMVNEMTYESFMSIETVIAEIPMEVSDDQFARGEAFRLTSLGKPYSVKEIFGFGWILFMKAAFNKKVSNPLKDGDSAYVCSKLIADYAGINDTAENLTPEDLYELVKNKTV